METPEPESDIGVSWECDGDCGCGVCCSPGHEPDPPYRIVSPGRDGQIVCGRFVNKGPCEACLRDAADA